MRLHVALVAALAFVTAVCAQSPAPSAAPQPPPTTPAPAAPAKPNIIFILADDLRADALGVSGNGDIHTPNLDALARRSAYFTRATVHVAQCCPARAMLLTGLAPHQSGYLSIDVQVGRCSHPDGFEGVATVPSLLAAAGYRTVLVGKWHIHPDPWRTGFTEVRRWFPEGQGPYSDPTLCQGPSRDGEVVPGFVTEIFADDAVAFLKSDGARERPFFLWVAPTAPHIPCEPTPERIGKLYEGKTSDDLVRPGIAKGVSTVWKDKWLPYYRAVSHLDEQTGRLLGALDETGLAKNTVVIFTSDSGEMMGRRGIDSKVVPYEDSVRIPIIIHDPRRAKAPAPSLAPVSALDLPPTILAIAGLKAPADWPGRDLSNLAAGRPDPSIRDAVCEWVDPSTPAWKKWGFHSIFDGRYKLIVWTAGTKPPELYDIDADPYEEHNLMGQDDAAPIAADLRARLDAWLKSTPALVEEKPAK